MNKIKIVCEIGCNHQGSMSQAKQLIKAAQIAGADYAKFQKRTNKDLLTAEEYNAPHPVPENSFGATYGEHREYLEFTLDQHYELKEYCKEVGIGYACSVWDIQAAREIAALDPDYLKIPSACNQDFELLEFCTGLTIPLHISTGMTTQREFDELVDYIGFENNVIYACTSGYPVPFNEVNLNDVFFLGMDFEVVGFSGHHIGINPDIAAMGLGATWIERHFTLNKNWKGTDHKCSLLPYELERLVQAAREIEQALIVPDDEILPSEVENRKKLKR